MKLADAPTSTGQRPFHWSYTALAHRWGWLVLLALAPLWLYPTAATSPFLLVIPLLLLFIMLDRRRGGMRTPLDWPLLLMAAMMLISLWATLDIGYGLGKLAGVIFGVGVFYSIVASFRTSNPRRKLGILLYLVLGGFFVVLAIVSTKWPDRVGVITALTARLPQQLFVFPGAESGLSFNGVAGTALRVAPLAWHIGARSQEAWPAQPPGGLHLSQALGLGRRCGATNRGRSAEVNRQGRVTR